jgi:hypothetical protein
LECPGEGDVDVASPVH